MSIGAMPGEECGWSKIVAQPVDVSNSSHDHDRGHRRFARAREKASRDGERGKSMRDDVHGYVFAISLDPEESPLPGTSSFKARGMILNSTGRRASGSPSTCA